jgi:hypothetical protein
MQRFTKSKNMSTELKLQKFLNHAEVRWVGDSLICWFPPEFIRNFYEIWGETFVTNNPIHMVLTSYAAIAVELHELCERNDLDPEDFLKKPTA